MTVTIKQLLSQDNYLDGLKLLEEDDDVNYLSVSYFKKIEDEDLKKLGEKEQEEYSNNLIIKDKYGFDLLDLWDFDITIYTFILARLYVFYKTQHSLEQVFEEGTWKEILEIILEFLLLKISFGNFDKTQQVIVDKGKMLLFKYFNKLWN